jgi:5-methylcytosine-specific restriction protein A
MPRRNPDWERDELILALDLYFRVPPNNASQDHPEVVGLSRLLNALPIHADRPDNVRFRNSNGVYMKLCNFLRFDPSYQGSGLRRGNKLEEAVWREFAQRPDVLSATAEAIRTGSGTNAASAPVDESGEEAEFPEGRVLFRIHRARERSPQLVRKMKARALRELGRLFCQVCGFDFEKTYGPQGRGFIECHHTVPLSTLASQNATRLSDLALVCSNCHRMLHRRRPWLTMSQLLDLMSA